ncbi:hypothetical protein [Iningainema tapete]|uniref:hypothetical protein n=1 Tax=Iningainema tapete TaxID=2806730 RepID=UPI0030D888B5
MTDIFQITINRLNTEIIHVMKISRQDALVAKKPWRLGVFAIEQKIIHTRIQQRRKSYTYGTYAS